MHVVKDERGRLSVIEAAEKQVFSGLALRILRSLSEEKKYPKQLAREMRVHEQKVYYHVGQLEKKGFLRVASREEKGGALAKLYELASPAFVVRFGRFQPARRMPNYVPGFLKEFIKDGMLDAKIIVGSSEPHGPERASSSTQLEGSIYATLVSGPPASTGV